jgi:cytochrome c oxidase assembly protein subunit 15
LKTLTGITLILVLLLVSLSAYLRLAHSGIGCADWPQCYGRIGAAPETTVTAQEKLRATGENAYRQLVEQSSQPLAWATPLHRLVASLLGLLVLILTLASMRLKRHRLVSLALLALTVWLAVLGIRSGHLHDPAVVMGNLAGGFTMLGLLGWLWFQPSPAAPASLPVPDPWLERDDERWRRHGKLGIGGSPPDPTSVLASSVLASSSPPSSSLPSTLLIGFALVLLAMQILLGGLTSANFAATACVTLPDCQGSYWPGPEIATALDLSRTHAVTPSGHAIGGAERPAIAKAHRLGAVLAGGLLLLTGALAWRGTGAQRRTGAAIVLLVVLEFSVGVTSVLSGLPIALAIAHNWLAALLLLCLVRLLVLNTTAPAG